MDILIGTRARHSSAWILLRTPTSAPSPSNLVMEVAYNQQESQLETPPFGLFCLSLEQVSYSFSWLITGSIISNFPNCTTSEGRGRCRNGESLRAWRQLQSKQVTPFVSAKRPSLLLLHRRQSPLPAWKQAAACSKLLLTQIPCCLVLLFVSHIIHIFLSYMHFSWSILKQCPGFHLGLPVWGQHPCR